MRKLSVDSSGPLHTDHTQYAFAMYFTDTYCWPKLSSMLYKLAECNSTVNDGLFSKAWSEKKFD